MTSEQVWVTGTAVSGVLGVIGGVIGASMAAGAGLGALALGIGLGFGIPLALGLLITAAIASGRN
jgi:hypothetical protein